MAGVELRQATDAHFAWLLGEGEAPADAPLLPDVPLAPPAILALLRGVAVIARAGDEARAVAWFAIVDGEACGLISFKGDGTAGEYEIGYGVASTRRHRGIATGAVAAVIETAAAQGLIALTAETAVDNLPSQTALQRNGFIRTGERTDPEDGPLYLWRRELAPQS